jgi:protein-S-isoprenylcysteine O-methyltransferase Ste14
MKTFFWVVVSAWLVLDSYVLLAKNKGSQHIVDRRSKFVIVAFIVTGVFLAIAPRDFRVTWRNTATFQITQNVGVMLMVAGVVLRLISILTLGKHFTPDIALTENHQLIRRGIYRFVRHPSYTGEILAFGGTALVFNHLLSSLVVFLFPFLGFLYRAILEERKLLELFGEEYQEYMSQTRRFI